MRAVSGGAVAALVVVVLIIAAGATYLYIDPPTSTTASTISTQLYTSTIQTASTVSPTTTSTAVTPPPNAVQVVIEDAYGEPPTDGAAQFNPQVITVVIGVNNTVTWTNQDQIPHNILTASGYLDSGDLSQGQTYTFTFTQAGTYHYYDGYYAILTGVVKVENP